MSQKTLRLNCLGGTPAPDDIVDDASRVAKLSPKAVENLSKVVELCATQPMNAEIGEHLASFCRHFEIAEADLGHIVRIACFLYRHAAALNLPQDAFAVDLAQLWPDAGALHQSLLEPYARIKLALRDKLLIDSLLKHGHVLDDVEWRIDQVIAANPAPRLDVPIALVTLNYRGRSENGALTLQMTPSQLMRLADVFTALAKNIQQLIPASGDDGNGSSH